MCRDKIIDGFMKAEQDNYKFIAVTICREGQPTYDVMIHKNASFSHALTEYIKRDSINILKIEPFNELKDLQI